MNMSYRSFSLKCHPSPRAIPPRWPRRESLSRLGHRGGMGRGDGWHFRLPIIDILLFIPSFSESSTFHVAWLCSNAATSREAQKLKCKVVKGLLILFSSPSSVPMSSRMLPEWQQYLWTRRRVVALDILLWRHSLQSWKSRWDGNQDWGRSSSRC